MRSWTLICLLMTSISVFADPNPNRLNKNGVALCADRSSSADKDCYDPVSYILDKKATPAGVEGAKNFRYAYKGATYVFINQAHMDDFKANPEKYLPQYGGWCAYAVAAKKDKVDIDPKSFHIQDGRLLLFYDGIWGDTKKTWITDQKKDAATYLKEADQNWPAVESKEP